MLGGHLTGVILAFDSTNAKASLSGSRILTPSGFLPGSKWERWRYSADRPLLGEDDTDGSWVYPVALRWSGRRAVLAGAGRRVASDAEKRMYEGLRASPCRRVGVKIDKLVKDLATNPGKYALTFVHGRVAAFGESLSSISFYGNDLGEADTFRQVLEGVTCVTVGVRHAAARREIARVGNAGSISFMYSDGDALTDVEEMLGYLRRRKYLEGVAGADDNDEEGATHDYDSDGQ